MFRNRFLNSVAFFLRPDDGAGQGAGGDQDPNQGSGGAEQQGGGDGQGSGAEAQSGAEASSESAEEGADEGEGGDGGQGDGGADEDDDPYAGLTPEQRARLEKHINREIGWRDRQLARATGKRRQAEEDTRAAATIIDQTQRGTPPATQQPDDVQAAARQLVAQERYDEACNNTDAAGRGAYGSKWSSATDRLSKMGGIPQADMADIVQGTDHPEVVLYSLAQDPDLYERVMSLPPAKRRSEFVKLGLKEPPKSGGTKTESKRPADTPPPPRTINGGSRQVAAQTVDLYKDNVDDDAWYKARNETRRKKFSNVQ